MVYATMAARFKSCARYHLKGLELNEFRALFFGCQVTYPGPFARTVSRALQKALARQVAGDIVETP